MDGGMIGPKIEEIEEYDKNKQGYKYICAIFTPSDNYLYCYVQHRLP